MNSDIELAFDQGHVATVDAKLDLAEIEIELKHGDRREAARLAKKLARSVPVTLSVGSKAELGYALVEGALNAPVFAERVVMAQQATVAEAFVAVSLACLRQMAGNHGAVRHGDPEGIHQMRGRPEAAARSALAVQENAARWQDRQTETRAEMAHRAARAGA